MQIRKKTDFLIIHHTATSRDTTTFEAVKKWHVDQGWDDLGYHYLITPYQVHKGRQENFVGAHAKDQDMNFQSVGICLTGNFQNEQPAKFQTNELEKLVRQLQKKYNIPNRNIIPHRALKATACPGINLMPFIDKLKEGQTEINNGELERIKKFLLEKSYKEGSLEGAVREMWGHHQLFPEKEKEIENLKDVKEDYRRKYEKEKAKRETYDNFIARIAEKLQTPRKLPEIEGAVQEILEKEDGETTVKKEFVDYKKVISRDLKKLGDVIGTVGEFDAVLEGVQALSVREKKLKAEMKFMSEENLKQKALIERYKLLLKGREEVREMKKDALFEAVKEPLRFLVLAILPFFIAYFGGLSYQWAAVATLLLRAIDKYLHNVGKETKDDNLTKGLCRF